MTKETMSVHRSLAELKLLDQKINKAIQSTKFAGIKRAAGKTIDNLTPDEFRVKSKESLQSILDLIRRRDAIKAAVVKSNATTIITIGNKEMTVAEAIDKKNTVQTQINLIDKLKYTSGKVHSQVAIFNEQLDVEALRYFAEITADKEKLNDNAFKALISAYKEEREQEVIEGFDVIKTYETLDNELEEFLTNVDYILSESNTETKIEIEY